MKTFILKPSFLALIVVCLFGTLNASGVQGNFISSCGTIIVEGDIMMTETEDPNAAIEVIILEGSSGTPYVFNGCGGNACSTDISRVPTGTYDVTVVTSDCTYYDTIYKS